ncbi:hypothetical protein IWW48_005726 [Coemansia sp. RSA 1200]|nr:hypothetical protein IWW48_005726 [Coemansia sp. RSA 1200]
MAPGRATNTFSVGIPREERQNMSQGTQFRQTTRSGDTASSGLAADYSPSATTYDEGSNSSGTNGSNGIHGSSHKRSASLLGRLRHSGTGSPSGSPTSSEGSSKDTARSERTLAHSASSGSMRRRKQAGMQRPPHAVFAEASAVPLPEASADHNNNEDDDVAARVSQHPSVVSVPHARALRPQPNGPSVRILPPSQQDATNTADHHLDRVDVSPATKSGKKRHSLRSGDSRSASGFISHLLRGTSRSTKSPHATDGTPSSSLSPADSTTASVRQIVHSPGTPQTPRSHVSVGSMSPHELDNDSGVEYEHQNVGLPMPHHIHQHHQQQQQQHHDYVAAFLQPDVCNSECSPACMASAMSAFTTANVHGIQCMEHAQNHHHQQQLQQQGVFCMQPGTVDCMGAVANGPPHVSGVATSAAMAAAAVAAAANGQPVNLEDFYYMHNGNSSNNMLGQIAGPPPPPLPPPQLQLPANSMTDVDAGDGGQYIQPDIWYQSSGPATSITTSTAVSASNSTSSLADTAQLTGRLVSSLPVYEPIDLSRVHQMQHGHNGYVRATQPVLPDARMLAPMTSLAEVYSSGAADYNALSTRELRFAVENHMLVEQHKYLIRDLGHARSAIGALKQVVQEKEDRLEQFEMVNTEMQQRLVLVESLLTQEQRVRLRSLRYSLDPASSAHSAGRELDDGASDIQAQGADYDSILSATQNDKNKNNNDNNGDGDENNRSHADSGEDSARQPTTKDPNNGQPHGAPLVAADSSSPTTKQGDPESKRNNRPLSGYTTRFALKSKPVHQLPRVFSGDYSATEVHAMESSVEALATVITSMPRDDTSVEEIIASKMAEDDQQIRDQICADEDQQQGDAHGRRKQQQQVKDNSIESPQEPKRRSRFLSMLRLSTFGGSSLSARDLQQQQQQDAAEVKNKRRSVSLGTRKSKQPHSDTGGSGVYVAQRSTSLARQEYVASAGAGRSRANSGESLAASCPTILPGIGKTKPMPKSSHHKEQHTLQRQSSSGSRFYPSGLGLSTENSSTATSRQSSTKASSSSVCHARDAEEDQKMVSGSTAQPTSKRDAKRRLSHRMSHAGQPRRSTSAPSRPHSMRVARRKSWLFQIFGSSNASNSSADSATSTAGGGVSVEHTPSCGEDDDVSDCDASEDDGGLVRRETRRRRVLTHSSDEITQFIGRLRLEDSGSAHIGGVSGGGGGGVLEDVIDVSGEDEERANRVSLSVAEIRQQTLDALNGTVRGEKASRKIERGGFPTDHAAPDKMCRDGGDRPVTNGDLDVDHPEAQSIGRWRQRDASGPTIQHLNPPSIGATDPASVGSPPKIEASSKSTMAPLGLGVSVARNDRTPTSFLPSITQTITSHPPPATTPTKSLSNGDIAKQPSSSATDSVGDAAIATPPLATRHSRKSSGASVQSNGTTTSSGARKWAPAFWAPPSLNYPGASLVSPTAGNSSWSPRGSVDSIEHRPSFSRRPSEERHRHRSPHSSIGFSTATAAGGAGTSATGSAGSPWELVRFSESRTFPLSPSHSRPGTPPSRPLAFFEDTTVPDSDELTVAARRSLSLRMSRNAFRQVEPLPESDDAADSAIHGENARAESKHDRKDGRSGKRLSRIRADGAIAADNTVEAAQTKQGLTKNAALSRVVASTQHKRRSLLWQFKEAKNGVGNGGSSTAAGAAASKTAALSGQPQPPHLAHHDGEQLSHHPSSSFSSSSSPQPPQLAHDEYTETTTSLTSATREPAIRSDESNGTDKQIENEAANQPNNGTRKHKRWWSVVLG